MPRHTKRRRTQRDLLQHGRFRERIGTSRACAISISHASIYGSYPPSFPLALADLPTAAGHPRRRAGYRPAGRTRPRPRGAPQAPRRPPDRASRTGRAPPTGTMARSRWQGRSAPIPSGAGCVGSNPTGGASVLIPKSCRWPRPTVAAGPRKGTSDAALRQPERSTGVNAVRGIIGHAPQRRPGHRLRPDRRRRRGNASLRPDSGQQRLVPAKVTVSGPGGLDPVAVECHTRFLSCWSWKTPDHVTGRRS